MNLNELIESVSLKATRYNARTFTKADVRAVLYALGDVASSEMQTEGGEIPLMNLGKLKADFRPARTGRNPSTGESIEIAAKNVVKFVASKALKEALA